MYWQGVVRPGGTACKAMVIQQDGNFHCGENVHYHPAEAGALTVAKIINNLIINALGNKFNPALAIVEEVFKLHHTDM